MGAVNRSKYSESVCDRYLAITGGLPDDEGSEDYEAVESDSNRRARLDGGPRACMCYNCRRGWRCKWDSDEEWDSEEEWDESGNLVNWPGRDLPADHADEERWDDLSPIFAGHPTDDLCVGDYVNCLYSDEKLYPAVIEAELGNGLYDISWVGGEYHGLPAKMRPVSLTQSWLNKDQQQETPQEPESS